MTTEAIFEETSADPRVASLPFAHVSVELGHLYVEDFEQGPDRLRELFANVAPWARTVHEVYASTLRKQRARVSTCFLVDDYFSTFRSPREVIPMLVEAAGAADLRIDYLARESACAQTPNVPLAELVVAQLVADPAPGTDGRRPPANETGWLCNGVRSPEPLLNEAMKSIPEWQPPSENGANRHSVFLDVELWSELPGGRQWSCPFLASVWQLLRLGALRMCGQPVLNPQPLPPSLPEEWPELPPVVQLTPNAAPFTAYRTFSIMGRRFLPIEHAVCTVLSQVAVEAAVTKQTEARAQAEGIDLPRELVDRVEYVFAGGA